MNHPLHARAKLSYRGPRFLSPHMQHRGDLPMDIALMVLAVVFFFWQTVSE